MKKFYLVLLFLLTFSLSFICVSAQQNTAKDGFKPAWFIGLNGGANWFLGEGNNFLDGTDRNSWSIGNSLGFLGRLELGYNFNSVYGIRFMAGYNQYNHYFKSRSTGVENVRPFPSKTLSADLMMNITNLTKGYGLNRKFTLAAFAGLGIAYMNDNVNTSNIGGSLLRGGLQANYRISPTLTLSLIGEANMLSDNSNDVVSDLFFDLSPDMAVAINYHFGNNKATTVAVDDKLPMKEKPVVKPEIPVVQEAATVDVIDSLNKYIFFAINLAEIQNTVHEDKMRIIAQYIQQNPSLTIVVSGFADSVTDSIDVNNELLKQRAVSVANTIIRKYGVPYENVWVRWYSTGVKPHADATKNRIVIELLPDVNKVVNSGSGIRKDNANPAFETAITNIETDSRNAASTDEPLSSVVYFDEKATELSKQDQKDIVMVVALYLRRNPEASVILSGYGDKSSDGEKVNNELSKQRAVHIANTLINNYSIEKDRIHVSWFGTPKEVGGKASLSKVVVIKSR